MSELRHDVVSDRLVIVAEARGARPHTLSAAPDDRHTQPEHCPFCPGHESMTPPEIARTGDGAPGTPGWRVRVFPNLYPITDAHEVVVLSPDHDRAFAELSDDEAVEVFLVLRDRVRALGEAGHAFATAILNQGRAAGASIAHPHAQVFALDFVPPEAAARWMRQRDARHDLLDADVALAREHDLVLNDEHGALTWCPYASTGPLVVRCCMRSTPPSDLAAARDDDVAAVARAARAAVARLDRVVADAPYNLVVQPAPRWHVEIVPRLGVLAGFEHTTGVFVTTLSPERSAAMLRDAPA